MALRFTNALLPVLLAAQGMAQCTVDTGAVGSPLLVSTGLTDTPFQTSEGRGARVQYLIPSAALQQIGLCAGADITAIGLHVVDTDAPGTLVTIRVLVKNETASCLQGSLLYSGLQTATQSFETHLDSGLLVIPFTSSPWEWAGPGFNALVDISIFRNEVVGISPRVAIDTTFNCSARYHYDSGGNVPGWELDETNSTFTTMDYLPLIELMGGFMPLSVDAGQVDDAAVAVRIYPNPSAGLVTVHLGANARAMRVVRVLDAAGRTIREAVAGKDGNVTFEGLAPGCYQVVGLGPSGIRRLLGRMVAE